MTHFWNTTKNQRITAGILWLLMLIFFFILIFRSCRHPERESVSRYRERLSDQVAENRIDAALGLGRLGEKDAVPDLERMLYSDPEARVKRVASYAIFVLDREEFFSLLKTSPEAEVRAICLETLARQEKEETIPYLGNALNDPSLQVRKTALKFLVQHPDARTVSLLLQVAEKTGEDTMLRVEALTGLARKAGKDQLERLKRLVEWEKNISVQRAAAAAIREIEVREKTEE